MDFRKRMQEPNVGFQMAPMVDIVFLLVIFLMVAIVWAEWEQKEGIQVPTSDSREQAVRQEMEIIVNIDKEGRFFINSQEMTLVQLEELLGMISSNSGSNRESSTPIIIRADGKTAHEHVVAVMNVCKRVDIWNIYFATIAGQKDSP